MTFGTPDLYKCQSEPWASRFLKQSCFWAVPHLGHRNPDSPIPIGLTELLAPQRPLGGFGAQDLNRGIPRGSRSSHEKSVLALPFPLLRGLRRMDPEQSPGNPAPNPQALKAPRCEITQSPSSGLVGASEGSTRMAEQAPHSVGTPVSPFLIRTEVHPAAPVSCITI